MSRHGRAAIRSASSIANDIRIRRRQFGGSLVVVEGGTDATALGQMVDRELCQVVVADTKANVLTVVPLLRAEGIRGLVGIVDADFDHLVGVSRTDTDLLVTDIHDLEMVLLRSRALDRVLAARGSAAKLRRTRAQHGSVDLRPLLLGIGARVGALRLHNERAGLGWRFEGLAFEHFLDIRALEVNDEALCQEIKNRSQQPKADLLEMLAAQRDVLAEGHDLWQLCCGHDVVAALRLALRMAVGSQRPSALSVSRLGFDLALAYEGTEFSVSSLAGALRAWEARNSAFVVLPR
jgi:Protein of unknown function (DUF4435)